MLAAAMFLAGAASASAAVRNMGGFSANVFPGNDDESTALVPLPFTANFFGNEYSALYVNNNGNVTFDSPLFEYTPFDLTSTGHVIIAAFFGDVDTRAGNLVTYGADTVDGHPAFGVEWPAVGYYAVHTDKLNSFELILIDRSDTGAGNFDIEFNYDQVQWETGDASDGVGGLGGASARVGFSNGTGIPGTFFELSGSGVNSAFLDGSPSGLVNNSRSTVIGRYVFEVRNGNVGTDTLPLIVLPGITGSYLHYVFGEAWPRALDTFTSPGDGFLDNLQLADDGVNPLKSTDATYYVDVFRDHGKQGIIDEIDMGCVFGHCAYRIQVYTPTFDFLESHGYEENVTVFPFAVDWRKSADYNASLLLDKIDAVLAATGQSQVNILAHSQGGLVAAAALSDFRSIGKVARVMTMGTPYLGATKALGVIDYGEPCQAEALGMCVLDNGEVQKLVRNFPGFLDLLPSREFYRVYPSPVFTLFDRDGDGLDDGFISYDDERAKLADRNLALIDQEAAFHDRVDYWFPADPTVQLVRLVGSGVPTIQTIIEYKEEDCSGILWWRNCELKEKSQFGYGNGDGTVPLHSADLYDPNHGFDDRGGAIDAYAPGVSHGDLVKKDETLTYAATYFAGAGGATPSAAPRIAAAAVSAQESGGLTFVPSLLAGTEILVKGAQYGLITDGAGNRLGIPDATSGVALLEIPGAVFNQATDTASSFVTLDGTYQGVWTATADGELQLVVRDYVDDAIEAVVSSPRIAVTAGAVLTLVVNRPTDLATLALAVDDNGDGTVDRTITFRPPVAGTAAADLTPPVSQVTLQKSFDPSGAQMVTVTIAATDQGGSGVDRIEYALDASDTSGVYVAPITVPATGNLIVRAFDGAGNVEAPYQMLPLTTDHFTCYRVRPSARFGIVPSVSLVDQFGSTTIEVKKLKSLCTPTSENASDPSAPAHPDHLTGYQIKAPKFRSILNQRIVNQFGTILVDVKKPDRLLVPSAKSLSVVPPAPTVSAVDHFQCYKAQISKGQPKFVPITGVTLEDQFGARLVDVTKPRRVCNPANQNDGEPGAENHVDHLICYQVKPAARFVPVGPIFVDDELGPETLDALRPDELCVPSLNNP